MSRYWGKNVVIDGSKIKEQFEDPLPVMGPPLIVTHDTLNTDPQAAAYEVTAQDVIRQVAKTSVGKILIEQINAAQKGLTIRPLSEQAIGLTGAIADDVDAAGRGNGSDVTIWYDPTSWGKSSAKSAFDPQNHYRPDDVLFHECVHALRMLRGLQDLRPVAWGLGYDNVEELYAILLTNVYVSSLNRNNDLRGDHRLQFHVLGNRLLNPGEQIGDMTFYSLYTIEIDSLCSRMRDLCHPISHIPCQWNPLRARITSLHLGNQMYGTPIPDDAD